MINAIGKDGNVSVVLGGNSEQLAEEIYGVIEAFAGREYEEENGGKFGDASEKDKLVSVSAMMVAILRRFAKKNGFEAVSAECVKLLVASAVDISRKCGE